MADMNESSQSRKAETDEPELPFQWQQVQSAIWLIGIAIIAWQGWWWPGMLVLVGISGLTQAGLSVYVKRQEEKAALAARSVEVTTARVRGLPANCPSCGASLDASMVAWRSETVATCPYCTAPVPAVLPEPIKTSNAPS